MFRKMTLIVLVAFALHACSSHEKKIKEVPVDQVKTSEKIVKLTLTDGNIVVFDKDGGKFDTKKQAIWGKTEDGKNTTVGIDRVLAVHVETRKGLSRGQKIGIAVAAVAGIALIIVAAKESCPFVYSFDGERYRFDAEPLGGAITRGMQKTDLSRLEHIVPVDGEYRLLFRNEVRETQFTDQVRLLVVDHDTGTKIIPGVDGKLRSVSRLAAPASARDERGNDISRFVINQDDVLWQTDLRRVTSESGGDLRHHLTFEFAKPPAAKTAHLIVNAGTALWGSHMIRAMLELRGSGVDAWYAGFNSGGPEVRELYTFMEREELYVMKVNVQEDTGWKQQGYVSGSGPFITEDRILDVDVSHVSGDRLTIRFDPPAGFWTLDHIAIGYDELPVVEPKEITLASAVDSHQKDVIPLLNAVDGKYQELTNVDEEMALIFDAPPHVEGTSRTVFLETTGYYELHLSRNQPEQKELIQTLLLTPGAIVEYAMQQYRQHGSQLAQSFPE